MFSIVAAPVSNPTNSVQRFPFLHILIDTCYALLKNFFLFFCFLFYFFNFYFLYFGCTVQHVGSQFPSQGWNPCALHWKHKVNLWTTREVLLLFLMIAIRTDVRYYLIVVFLFISLMISDLSKFSRICWPIYMSFLENGIRQ